MSKTAEPQQHVPESEFAALGRIARILDKQPPSMRQWLVQAIALRYAAVRECGTAPANGEAAATPEKRH